MGFFSDIMDDWFGFDPAPVYNYNYGAGGSFGQQPAADPAPAPAADPAPAAAPAADPTPAAPVSVFDPTPYRSQVDTGFSQFTPDFYANKFAEAYNPYKSGLDTQYGSAHDLLESGLARKGLANSTQSKGLFQQLDALRDQAINTGQTAAQNFQSTLTGDVGKAKDALYGTIAEGADNASLGTRATTEASRLAGTKAPAPALGDIFGSLVLPYSSGGTTSAAVNPESKAFATGSNLNLANVGGGPEASTQVVNKKKKF